MRTMTKPKSINISTPFDARHVSGVSVPGATIPIAGIQRASTSTLWEPDEPPSHTNAATGNVEVPRRSHTIASTLGRPSLRLKTSISRLRARSSSNSPDIHRTTEVESTSEMSGSRVQMPNMSLSLRKKPSMSRLRQRLRPDAPPRDQEPMRDGPDTESKDEAPVPLMKDSPTTKLTASISRPPLDRGSNPLPAAPPLPPRSASTSLQKRSSPTTAPLVRPKRADSGTAIDFDDVPMNERPKGFKEIMAVRTFAERMALYKKTRDYWAHADHGLADWVASTGGTTLRPFKV